MWWTNGQEVPTVDRACYSLSSKQQRMLDKALHEQQLIRLEYALWGCISKHWTFLQKSLFYNHTFKTNGLNTLSKRYGAWAHNSMWEASLCGCKWRNGHNLLMIFNGRIQLWWMMCLWPEVFSVSKWRIHALSGSSLHLLLILELSLWFHGLLVYFSCISRKTSAFCEILLHNHQHAACYCHLDRKTVSNLPDYTIILARTWMQGLSIMQEPVALPYGVYFFSMRYSCLFLPQHLGLHDSRIV